MGSRINSDNVTDSMIDDVEFIPVCVLLILLLYDARQLLDDHCKIDVLIEGKMRDLYVHTKCAHVSIIIIRQVPRVSVSRKT